jgi:hypothetical protein
MLYSYAMRAVISLPDIYEKVEQTEFEPYLTVMLEPPTLRSFP